MFIFDLKVLRSRAASESFLLPKVQASESSSGYIKGSGQGSRCASPSPIVFLRWVHPKVGVCMSIWKFNWTFGFQSFTSYFRIHWLFVLLSDWIHCCNTFGLVIWIELVCSSSVPLCSIVQSPDSIEFRSIESVILKSFLFRS
jgi:hypothetical protein